MCKELKTLYILACEACQQNKSSSTCPAGPLHPLPVPDKCGTCIAMDFIDLLPEDNNFNCILTITNHLGADLRIVPYCTDISAKDLAVLFFCHWYCKNSLPLEIVSNRDMGVDDSTLWVGLVLVRNTISGCQGPKLMTSRLWIFSWKKITCRPTAEFFWMGESVTLSVIHDIGSTWHCLPKCHLTYSVI